MLGLRYWLTRRLGLCLCGTWTCRLDWLTRCKIQRLCDAHDAAILGDD